MSGPVRRRRRDLAVAVRVDPDRVGDRHRVDQEALEIADVGRHRPVAVDPDDRIAIARDVELDDVVEPDRAARRRDRTGRQHGVARTEHGELVDRDPAGGAHRDVERDLAGGRQGSNLFSRSTFSRSVDLLHTTWGPSLAGKRSTSSASCAKKLSADAATAIIQARYLSRELTVEHVQFPLREYLTAIAGLPKTSSLAPTTSSSTKRAGTQHLWRARSASSSTQAIAKSISAHCRTQYSHKRALGMSGDRRWQFVPNTVAICCRRC